MAQFEQLKAQYEKLNEQMTEVKNELEKKVVAKGVDNVSEPMRVNVEDYNESDTNYRSVVFDEIQRRRQYMSDVEIKKDILKNVGNLSTEDLDEFFPPKEAEEINDETIQVGGLIADIMLDEDDQDKSDPDYPKYMKYKNKLRNEIQKRLDAGEDPDALNSKLMKIKAKFKKSF